MPRGNGQLAFDFNLGAAFRAVEALGLGRAPAAILKAILSCGPTAFPSVEEIGRRTKYSRRAIQLATRDLAGRGLLTIEERRRENGSQSSNAYRPTGAVFEGRPAAAPVGEGGEGGAIFARGGRNHCAGGGATIAPPFIKPMNETHEKNHKRKRRRVNFGRPISRDDLADDFALSIFFIKTIRTLPDAWADTPADRRHFRELASAARSKPNPGGWFNVAISNKRPAEAPAQEAS